MSRPTLSVIGGGLAGCEAACAAARLGATVTLYEMKPIRFSPAHHNADLCELVCSNSLKAQRVNSASGLQKEELRRLGSVTLAAADEAAVEAGGALAVDRGRFAAEVTKRVENCPGVTVVRREITALPEGCVIIAAGPLCDGGLAETVTALCGERPFFFDAVAPIVTAESIDRSRVFAASRYGRGGDDYLNCPMDRAEYEAFVSALATAEDAPLHDFEGKIKVYEGCMPVEVLARRGPDSLRFGPLKPIGLTDPSTGRRPWADVQLRRENAAGSLYNLVGFQTHLKFGEQKRVFSMIPGLENAEFVRYGVMHRNTYIDSPRLLEADLSLKAQPSVFFAGQITGVEGYTESAVCGLVAGYNAAAKLIGKPPLTFSPLTMTGALLRYVTDPLTAPFAPMGANFGLLPPLPEHVRDKQLRCQQLADRALAALETTLLQM